jgi:uncharacterized OB-fold protein
MEERRSAEFAFFYEGLGRGELLVQQCGGCGRLRNPPSAMCGVCGSLDWAPHRLSGAGIVHSYTIHHYPPLPGFATPHPVGLIDMAEGIRMVGGMDGTPLQAIAIGLPVAAEFITREGRPGFRFRLVGDRA